MPIIFEEYHSKRHKQPFGTKTILIDSEEALAQFIQNVTQYENIYYAKDMEQSLKIAMYAREESLPKAYLEAFKTKYVGFYQYVGGLESSRDQLVANNADSSFDSSVHLELDPDDDDLMNAMEELYEDNPELGLENDTTNRAADPLHGREELLFARARGNSEPEIVDDRRFTKDSIAGPDQYEQYEMHFGGEDADPFYNLAVYIQSLDNNVTDMPGHGQTYHFKRHLDSILPIVALAVNGSRKEYQDSQDLEPAQRALLLKKMEAFEDINGMLQSLRALANNKSRYTEGYFNTKLESINHKLEDLGVKEEAKNALLEALIQVASKNLMSDQKADRFYQHKKGSTAFDASGDKMEIKGHQKRLKIEHHKSPDSGSIVVTGKFNYSRKSVIGVQTGHFTGVKKIFAQQKDQRNEMKDQVADFVTTALFDFQKGTEKNPIYLQPSKGNQSELSLAILLEFKKRAILEGKELIAADDNGRRITITPNSTFTPNEKAYFQSFALQIPKVEVGRGKLPVEAEHCAGFQLLQEVKLSGKRLKEQEYSEDTIVDAMTQHLTDTVAAHVKEQGKSIDAAIKSIPPEAGIDSRPSTRMNV